MVWEKGVSSPSLWAVQTEVEGSCRRDKRVPCSPAPRGSLV